ncbi:MAG: UDP-N-acetylmuramoyl-L-alanyl-D-glutamate--2,6-diaminopimelate ligase [Lachnospiraceae bacterium]|jgi:UDP-N-acetylmuramoyl-L-alanyl-D-glutamate--2,6-diaminopimelate ligase
MKLGELLEGVEYSLEGSKKAKDLEVTDVTNDSRKVIPGSLFFCIPGAVRDGHDFAPDVEAKGASVLVIEHDVKLAHPEKMVLVRVPSARRAMALIAANWYHHPARQMKMIGVTGTKGKTTTTYLVRSVLLDAGIDTGLIGTIESAWHDHHIPSGNTTPESLALQKTLRQMADDGVKAVIMEVSSQALMLERTAGILYDIGVFTNISPDHIGPNEHASFEDYMHCKGLLFQQCKVGIVNGDDPHLAEVLSGHTCSVETFGLNPVDNLYATDMELIKKPGELGISFHTHGKVELTAQVPTPGSFSVYNALCAIAICTHFDVTKQEIEESLKSAHVRGRIEMVKVSDEFTLMIDYAHNAVALESLLTTLREYHPHRLVTLFGCGGNRSRLRRFEMGEVSGKLSDFTIITSDNPRFEEPMDIIHDIETGMKKTDGKYVTIPDRKEAIAYAIHHGEKGDIIVLAGKGHEDYQEIKGVKYPMDERVLIREILEEDRKEQKA